MPKIRTSSTTADVTKRGATSNSNSNITKLLEQTNKSLADISAALKLQVASFTQSQKELAAERKRQQKLEKEADQRRKEAEAQRKKWEKSIEKQNAELKKAQKKAEKEAKAKAKEANASKPTSGKSTSSSSNTSNEPSFASEVGQAVLPEANRPFMRSTVMGAALGIDPRLAQAFGLDEIGKAVTTRVGKAGHNMWEGFKNFIHGDKANDSSKEEKGKAVKEGAYGSVTEANTPITRRLDTIIKLLGGKPPKEKKAEEKKEEKGFFDTFLGKAIKGMGRMLLPLLAAGLMSLIKPFIEKLLSNLLGSILGEELGGMFGGIIADMLPGAIAGYTYSKLVMGKANWKAILIGGGISLAYYTIKRKVDEVMDILNGEPHEIKVEDYLDMAIRGAIIGATCVGFGKGSLKAAILGAGIGVGVQWVINRVSDIQKMIDGEEVEIKEVTIGGVSIPESAFGAMISGALIGLKFGGFKGMMLGALLGGGLGMLWATITDFHNQLESAKNGKYVEPKEVCGVPYAIMTGLIGGAGIGLKFAGFWPGLVVGALIGGLAGWIMNEVQKYIGKTRASEATAEKDLEGNANFQQMEQQNQADQAIINDPNADPVEKKKAQARIAQAKKLREDTKAKLAGFTKWDKNGDGILDDKEQEALDNGWFKSGNSMDMQDAMKEMRSKGIAVTKENLMQYEYDKLSGQQQIMGNVINVANGLPTVPMQTSSQMSIIEAEKTQTKLAEATEKLADMFEKVTEGDLLGNETTVNVASTPQRSSIEVYGSGSAAQSSMGG